MSDETIAQRVFAMYVHDGLSAERIAEQLALDRESVWAILNAEAARIAAERAPLLHVEREKSLALLRDVLARALAKPPTPTWLRTIIMATKAINQMLGLNAPMRFVIESPGDAAPAPVLDANAGLAALERIIGTQAATAAADDDADDEEEDDGP